MNKKLGFTLLAFTVVAAATLVICAAMPAVAAGVGIVGAGASLFMFYKAHKKQRLYDEVNVEAETLEQEYTTKTQDIS